MEGWLTSDDIAKRLGVKRTSVHRMHTRGDLPPADDHVGRTPVWRPETIAAWEAGRPGQGWRAGRKES